MHHRYHTHSPNRPTSRHPRRCCYYDSGCGSTDDDTSRTRPYYDYNYGCTTTDGTSSNTNDDTAAKQDPVEEATYYFVACG